MFPLNQLERRGLLDGRRSAVVALLAVLGLRRIALGSLIVGTMTNLLAELVVMDPPHIIAHVNDVNGSVVYELATYSRQCECCWTFWSGHYALSPTEDIFSSPRNSSSSSMVSLRFLSYVSMSCYDHLLNVLMRQSLDLPWKSAGRHSCSPVYPAFE